MDDKYLFMQRFKTLLKEHNTTVEELGKILGVTKGTVSKYMNGKISMPVEKLSMMAKHFNVSPLWLSGLDDQKYISNRKEDINVIPLVGTVAAGLPIIAEQNIEDYIHTRHKADFCLRVKGDSMINARIHDGDIVFVKKQPDVEDGQIAVVMVDNDATVKRVYKDDNNIILQPENPSYKPMVYKKSNMKKIRIIGKVIGAEILFE